VKFDTVLATINWHSLVVVVIFRLLTFFWIPAHTITFLLPPVYRVLCAAILGFVLGVLLAFFKRYKGANPTETPNTDALPAA
jgi:ABC-type polysaccharide/polyol phosphate export permease